MQHEAKTNGIFVPTNNCYNGIKKECQLVESISTVMKKSEEAFEVFLLCYICMVNF